MCTRNKSTMSSKSTLQKKTPSSKKQTSIISHIITQMEYIHKMFGCVRSFFFKAVILFPYNPPSQTFFNSMKVSCLLSIPANFQLSQLCAFSQPGKTLCRLFCLLQQWHILPYYISQKFVGNEQAIILPGQDNICAVPLARQWIFDLENVLLIVVHKQDTLFVA